jgi:hypothetical protein
MKKLYYIIAAFVLLFGSTSCSDFLQKDPTESPSQDTFWQKKSDFDSALAGIYSVLYERPFSGVLPCWDGLTDNAIVRFSESTYGEVMNIAKGDLTPNQGGFVSDVYNNCYKGIARVHIFMEQLSNYQNVDITDEEKTFMIAQCKALRGYFYSWLYQCYRQVPLVTSSLDLNNMYQPKAERSAILQQILTDYNEAIADLPDKLYTEPEVSGRFTKAAVQALKARLLLFDAYDENGVAKKENMEEIQTVLESIRSGYSLASRTRDNFISTKQASSPEIMFSVRYLRPNLTNSMDKWYGLWSALTISRDLLDAFECTDGEKWGVSPLTVRPDEAVLYGTDKEAKIAEREKMFINRDRRMSESIFHSQKANFKMDGLADESIKLNDDNNESPTGFSMLKYIQPISETLTESVVSDQDVVIMRYAHVLLMKAEVENELHGPTEKALSAVNEVRDRSGQRGLCQPITQDELRERIRNEWRVETCFEGLRYFQLKRWKMMDKLNNLSDPGYPAYIKVYAPAFEFFPIPQTEIDKSNGILEQDPNYK